MGLHHRQVVIDQPHLHLVVTGPYDLRAGPMPVAAVKANPLTHPANQLVCQLGLVSVADSPISTPAVT